MPRYTERIEQERAKWRQFTRQRPADIPRAGPGQESVWDYPRPPRVEPVPNRLRVEFAGIVLAETVSGFRVLETSSPPVYYFPPVDVRMEWLVRGERTTLCEWKGLATYWSVHVGDRFAEQAAWSYLDPDQGYEAIHDYLAFFAGTMDACYVGDQQVTAQPGHYYGGWVTPETVGPFKGLPGTEAW